MDKHVKVGIAGVGMVGNALGLLFFRNPKIEVVLYDKYKPEYGNAKRLDDCDFVFLCLPTQLTSWDDRVYDLTAIYEVLGNLGKKPLVILKSTVKPNTTQTLISKFHRTIVFNPEFLREKSATDDVISETRIVLGGGYEPCERVAMLYQTVMAHDVRFQITDTKTAELVKIASNAFLAAKVIFFNEIKKICDAYGINYLKFREILTSDPRIGQSHTMVTEEGGFGGHCMPKEVNALISDYKSKNIKCDLLKTVWNVNCKTRKEFKGKEVK